MANHVVIRPFEIADHLETVLDAAYAAGFEVVAPDPLGAGSGWLLARRRVSDVGETERILYQVDDTVRQLEAQRSDLDAKIAEERSAAVADGTAEYAPPASEWSLRAREWVGSDYWQRHVVDRKPLPTNREQRLTTDREEVEALRKGWMSALGEIERLAELA